MKALIVTNSYNRSKDIVERSLRASIGQSFGGFQLLFIDQNYDPIALSKDIISDSKFNFLKSDKKSVSSARNEILKFSKLDQFDWIVFCDDDGYLSENYFDRLLDFLGKNSNLEIVAGAIKTIEAKEYYSIRHKIGGSMNEFYNHKLLMGSNFAVKTSVFKKLGGFDEKFGTGAYWGSGEESDFCLKAYFENVKMSYDKDLIAYHPAPYSSGNYKAEFIKTWKYSLGKGALVAKWLVMNAKAIVILEFFEMLIVPIMQMIRAVIKLQFKSIPFYFIQPIGRLVGFFKYILIGAK